MTAKTAGCVPAETASQGTKLMSGLTIKPILDWVYVRKTLRRDITDDDRILIALPETVANTTNWCEILAVGPKCQHIKPEHVGGFVFMPEMCNGMHRLGDCKYSENEDFCIKEPVLMEHFAAVVKAVEHSGE